MGDSPFSLPCGPGMADHEEISRTCSHSLRQRQSSEFRGRARARGMGRQRVGRFETLGYEAGEDGVAWVTLDRPEVHNAFDARMLRELRTLWRELREDDAVRVVVLTGAGERAFCTGVDRGALAD